ncbi:MAG TPA: response regulator [Clostridiaceae bacterium]
MLNLLIADDEKYDRDSIVNMITTEFKDMFEIYEARNGREAIEMSERFRPDIIISDIKMPGINGLKATQEINKFLPNTYIIILTAYDYFDFAIEAVKYNVKQYILKPFSKVDIIEKITEAVSFVNNEKEKRRSEIENQEKLYNLIPILENELSYSIINNNLHLIDFETYLKYLNLDFKNGYSIVAELKDLILEENFKFQVGEFIKEYINHRSRAIGSYLFTKKFVYFIQINGDLEEDSVKFNSISLAEAIRREVKKVFNVSLNLGIGVFRSSLEQLSQSYEEACTSLEHISDSNKIVYFGDIVKAENLGYAEGEKVALFKAVEQYIIDNLQEEIDLEKTSAKFNLSAYYFSRSFKEIVGCNFSDYINIVRTNKAKELLKNDIMSIKEVCYLVGYSDPNYFSKVFKKYAGLSPSEFKSK